MGEYWKISEAFYAEHGDEWVLVNWNGIKPGNHGKQSCAFITPDMDALDRWRLASIFPDDALRFDSRESAEAFLAGEEWATARIADRYKAVRLADLESHAYFVQTKSALIGGKPRGVLHEAAPSAPAKP